MVGVPFSYGTYHRSGFPPLNQINMVAERTSSQQRLPYGIIVRPALEAFAEVGAGPLRGINRKAGLFDESAVIVSRNSVYLLNSDGSVTSTVGALLTTSGRVQIALGRDPDGNSVARIADGTRLYLLSGGSLVAEEFPTGENAGAISVVYLRQFWFAVKAGTQQVYYQLPGDTMWNALDFASAEYQPDPLVGLATLGDQLLLGGSATAEYWALTGTSSPAVAPYGGLNFDIGVLSRDTMVNVNQSLIWVTDKCQVAQSTGSTPRIVSDNGLVEQIRLSNPMDLCAWTFSVDQHMYYVLCLGPETWVFDVTTELWTNFATFESGYFHGTLGVDVTGTAYCFDSFVADNQVWRVNPALEEDSEGPIQAEATAFFETTSDRFACGNISIIAAVGMGLQSGQGSAPQVAMRYSDDQGRTWSSWKWRSLGRVGQYSQRVRWNRLGTIKAPGRYFQFRRSDPVVYRLSDVRMNEQL